jgi:hypothetical protein
MEKASVVIFLALCIAATALGQTSADLTSKYRQVISYEVRPGVLVTPKYTVEGQVCEMVIERRHKTDKEINFGSSFSEKEVKELADELVPQSERGKALTELLNTSVSGGFITTEYTYENVLIRVYGTTRPEPAGDMVVTITWRKRVCGGAQQPSATTLKRDNAATETVKPKQ